MDLREKLIKDISIKLSHNFEHEDINTILNIVILEIDNYELSPRSTYVTLRDNSSEKLLEIYAGSLLTVGKSKKTVYSYIRFLRRFYDDTKKPFIEMSKFEIMCWLANQQNTISLASCENYRAYLSAFYTWLKKEKFMTENPMESISPIKVPKVVRKSYSDLELDVIRKTCLNLRDRAVIELLLCSGIRVGELCALNISDIDFISKSFLVREAKGGKQRVAYLNDVAIYYIKEYLKTRTDDNLCLFLNRNHNRVTNDNIQSSMRKLGELTGIKKVHAHRFRRTFATNLHKRGMDIHTIQKLLGHENIDITTRYIAESDDMIKYEYRKYS